MLCYLDALLGRGASVLEHVGLQPSFDEVERRGYDGSAHATESEMLPSQYESAGELQPAKLTLQR